MIDACVFVPLFDKIKEIFLKFRQSPFAICRRCHWMMWSAFAVFFCKNLVLQDFTRIIYAFDCWCLFSVKKGCYILITCIVIFSLLSKRNASCTNHRVCHFWWHVNMKKFCQHTFTSVLILGLVRCYIFTSDTKPIFEPISADTEINLLSACYGCCKLSSFIL